MKTNNIFNIVSVLLGVTIALTSCHREDIPYYEDQKGMGSPISFSSIDASLETKSDAGPNSFHVWASLTNGSQTLCDVFDATGEDVTYNQTKKAWTYSPVRYWQDGTYNFIAVAQAPESVTGELKDTGLELTFTNGWNLNNDKKDLLLAVALNEPDRLNASSVTPVSLVFGHQLSMINFSAKNTDEREASLVIISVEISGNHKTASGLKHSMLSTSSATWSYTGSTSEKQTLPLYGSASSVALNKETHTPITEDVIVFPEEKCELEVSLTFIETINNVDQIVTKSAKISPTYWSAGKKYEYSVNLTSDRLVFGEPNVIDWADGGLVSDEFPF
jgi:hypothetical protein